MKIKLNNQEVETQATTLAALVQELRLPAEGIAAAVDNVMVPRVQWAEKTLTEGCAVIIIKAACGG